MKKKKLIIIVGIVVVLLGSGFFVTTKVVRGMKPEKKTDRIETVRRGPFVVKLSESGNMDSLVKVEVRSNVEGEVVSGLARHDTPCNKRIKEDSMRLFGCVNLPVDLYLPQVHIPLCL